MRRVRRHSVRSLRHKRPRMIRIHVLADRLQPLQNPLPLCPIELPQERPKTLNERILEHRLAIRLRNEEPVQTNSQRFGNLFERAEAGRHLPALDSGQIRARYARARLQLALRHPTRFPQLPDSLADVLDSLAIRPVLEQLAVITR